MNLKPIGILQSCFKQKFGTPRQSGLVHSASASIVIDRDFRDLDWWRGIEDWKYLWITFGFHLNAGVKNSPMVRLPRSGGKQKKGVFATRSSFRPSGLGLSLVKLDDFVLSDFILKISGHDMVEGTPIYDIKPYIPQYDCREIGELPVWFEQLSTKKMSIEWPSNLDIGVDDKKLIEEVLQYDPRPEMYWGKSSENEFKMLILDYDVIWICDLDSIHIKDVRKSLFLKPE